ncbi:MAG: 5-oxoprolinase subunit PxpB [Proteobacteria bacterium]|nr:5-oxoprolinase subunit PxpB [Pseudomonadota bacterium]
MPPNTTGVAGQVVAEGDGCLIVRFGSAIDLAVNRRVQAFATRLMAAGVEGVLDVVPAFTTVAVHYRPAAFEAPADGMPFDALRVRIEALLAAVADEAPSPPRSVEIPVCYGGEHGPDLDAVAAACGCTPAEAIKRHGASPHVVGMLGFAPGFAYIAGLDERLAVPRRATPRTRIPVGSVAIAGSQSAVYPLETPGGWNLIGRTPLAMFDIARDPPCLLQPGDEVHFVPITPETYAALSATVPP